MIFFKDKGFGREEFLAVTNFGQKKMVGKSIWLKKNWLKKCFGLERKNSDLKIFLVKFFLYGIN